MNSPKITNDNDNIQSKLLDMESRMGIMFQELTETKIKLSDMDGRIDIMHYELTETQCKLILAMKELDKRDLDNLTIMRNIGKHVKRNTENIATCNRNNIDLSDTFELYYKTVNDLDC